MLCQCTLLVSAFLCLIITTSLSASVRQLNFPTIATGDANANAQPAPVTVTPPEASANTAPGTAPAAAASTVAAPAADWNLISKDGSGYSIFARAIRAAGYSGVLTSLHGGNGLTIFAPNDAAFATTLKDLGYTGTDGQYEAFVRMNAIGALYEIVGYHIVPRGFSLEMLQKSSELVAYSGELISVKDTEVQQVATSLTAPKISGAAFLVDNAIVYPIDRVLFPFDVDVEKTKNLLSVTPPSTNGTEAAAFLNTTGIFGNGTEELNCFPAYTTVLRKDGKVVRMDQLEIGDDVLVDTAGTYSKVYLFTHRSPYARSEFIKITTSVPNLVLTVSAGHYVYRKIASSTMKELTRADGVRLGDIVHGVNGEAKVTKVERVVANGLYAPHSYHGDIVVDGIQTSSYTAAMDVNVAHASLALIRALRYLEGMMGLRWNRRQWDCVWDIARKCVLETRKRDLRIANLISTSL